MKRTHKSPSKSSFNKVMESLQKNIVIVMRNLMGELNEQATTQYVYNQLDAKAQLKGNSELATRCQGYSFITNLDQKLIDSEWSGPLFDMLGYKLNKEDGEVLSVSLMQFDFKSSLQAILHENENGVFKKISQIDPTASSNKHSSLERTINDGLYNCNVQGADALSRIFEEAGHSIQLTYLAYEGNIVYERGAFIIPHSVEIDQFGSCEDAIGNEIAREDIITIPQVKARKLARKILKPLSERYEEVFGSDMPNSSNTYFRHIDAIKDIYKAILLQNSIPSGRVRFNSIWGPKRSSDLLNPTVYNRHVDNLTHCIQHDSFLAAARGEPSKLIGRLASYVAQKKELSRP